MGKYNIFLNLTQQIMDALPVLLDKSGNETKIGDDIQVVCFYYSAHWCPPCRGFTPVLAEWYKEAKAAGKAVEVVFLSSDRDEPSFKDYWNSMPWLAAKFGDAQIQNWKQKHSVTGIPKLVVMNAKTMAVINDNGRGDVSNGGVACFDQWAAKC